MIRTFHRQWARVRSGTLVVACSDGRLQEATDAFLADEIGLTEYDRLYLPGGGGALAASGRDFIRAHRPTAWRTTSLRSCSPPSAL